MLITALLRTTRRSHHTVSAQIVSVLLALLLSAAAVAADAPITRLMIQFEPAAAPTPPLTAPTARAAAAHNNAALAALAQQHGVALRLRRSMNRGVQLVDLPHAMSVQAAQDLARRLKKSAGVKTVEPDYLRRASATISSSGSALTTPNDAHYNEQWALLAPSSLFNDSGTNTVSVGGTNAPPAWAISTGNTSGVVAIIDTGILPHSDFNDGNGQSRVLPGYDFISDAFISNKGGLTRGSGALDTGDWVSNADTLQPQCTGQLASDSSWHGTHVAGIAAATGNNTVGVAGVNWGVQILPLRVLGKCGGYDSDIIDAIYWAAGFSVSGVPANSHPADVINLSLGGAGACTSAYQTAFDALYNSGVVVVVAAGNEAQRQVDTPANCNHVIAVTAHSLGGLSSYYANTGGKIAISAPGGGQGTNPSGYAFGTDVGIVSLGNTGLTNAVADTYTSYSGTSQATAFVSATAALIRGILPTVTPDRLQRFITASSRSFPAGSWCVLNGQLCGAGLLDIGGAVQAANFAALNNHAPTASALPNQQGTAGVSLSFALPVSDIDGDSLSVQAVLGLPHGATINSTGSFYWARPVAGQYTVLYQVNDGIAYSPSQQVIIDIAPAPPAPAAGAGGGGGSISPALLILLVLGARLRRRHSLAAE